MAQQQMAHTDGTDTTEGGTDYYGDAGVGY